MKRRTVRFSPGARESLDAIWYWVSKDGNERADRLIDHLIERSMRLGRMAGLGRPYPHRPGARIYSVSPYVIVYEVEPDSVVITHVVHGAQDIDRILKPPES